MLRSIHEAQLSSEDDTVHLGHVTKRWLGVKEALVTMHQGGASSLYDVIKPDGIWAEVYKKQTTDIHWVAYYLDLASAGAIGHSDHIQQAVFFLCVGTYPLMIWNGIKLSATSGTFKANKDDFFSMSQMVSRGTLSYTNPESFGSTVVSNHLT